MAAPSAVSSCTVRRARHGLAARIGIILACIVVYRLGTHIPLPGITAFIPMKGVNGLERFSVFTLDAIPYLSASMLMQLVLWGWPGAAALRETAAGRRKINGYIRALTLALAVLQAVAVTAGIMQFLIRGAEPPPAADMLVRIVMIATLTAGAMAVMWLCEQIRERCAVDGAMVIMLVNAAAQMPVAILGLSEKIRAGIAPVSSVWPPAVLLVAVMAAMVFFESARRRLPVEGGTALPLPLNGSGALAPMLAGIIVSWLWGGMFVWGNRPPDLALSDFHLVNIALCTLLILPVAFFARTNGFNPVIAAAFLRAGAKRIPGVGADKTAAYAGHVLARISVAGVLYLAAVYAAVEAVNVLAPFHVLSATSMLMAVLVTLDLRAGSAGRYSR